MNTLSALLPARQRKTAALRAPWLSWTIAFAVCLSAALVGVESWQMWNVREAGLRNARDTAASLAQSIALQAETTFKTADTVVASIGQRVEAEGVGPPALERLYGLMTSLAEALPAIHEMGITDKDGNAIVKSLKRDPHGMNYSERDYFRFLKQNDSRSVYVGEPVKSKIDGSLNITISRRINDANGGFAGVVVSSVSMDFFRQMFESVQAKSGVHISLDAGTGAVLARSHPTFGDNEYEALSGAAGALEYVSPNDHVRRVGAYSRLAGYPMLALVARDSDDILATWRLQVRNHAAVMFCVLWAIAFLGYRLDQASRATRIQALRDTLTGLPNRRCLNDAVDVEFRRAARGGRALSYIMADIDLFKNFNDSYGHQAGDDCLVAVANAIQGVLERAGDMAARYGGEEIAILLPDTDVAGAMRIAECAQRAVAELRIPHQASPNGFVTVSAGVASCPAVTPSDSSAALLRAADLALYAAKAAGRNAIRVQAEATGVMAAA